MDKEAEDKMTAQQMTQWVDHAIDEHRTADDVVLTTYEMRLLRMKEPPVPPPSDDDEWAKPGEFDTRTFHLQVLLEAEERLRAIGRLSQADDCIIRLFKHHGSIVGVARRLKVDRHTASKHIDRIDRMICREAGLYQGWWLVYLEDINRGKHYFEVWEAGE